MRCYNHLKNKNKRERKKNALKFAVTGIEKELCSRYTDLDNVRTAGALCDKIDIVCRNQ